MSSIDGFGAMVAWSSDLDAVIAVTLSGSIVPQEAFWVLHQALALALETPEPR
jgi:hypothetical protein